MVGIAIGIAIAIDSSNRCRIHSIPIAIPIAIVMRNVLLSPTILLPASALLIPEKAEELR